MKKLVLVLILMFLVSCDYSTSIVCYSRDVVIFEATNVNVTQFDGDTYLVKFDDGTSAKVPSDSCVVVR